MSTLPTASASLSTIAPGTTSSTQSRRRTTPTFQPRCYFCTDCLYKYSTEELIEKVKQANPDGLHDFLHSSLPIQHCLVCNKGLNFSFPVTAGAHDTSPFTDLNDVQKKSGKKHFAGLTQTASGIGDILAGETSNETSVRLDTSVHSSAASASSDLCNLNNFERALPGSHPRILPDILLRPRSSLSSQTAAYDVPWLEFEELRGTIYERLAEHFKGTTELKKIMFQNCALAYPDLPHLVESNPEYKKATPPPPAFGSIGVGVKLLQAWADADLWFFFGPTYSEYDCYLLPIKSAIRYVHLCLQTSAHEHLFVSEASKLYGWQFSVDDAAIDELLKSAEYMLSYSKVVELTCASWCMDLGIRDLAITHSPQFLRKRTDVLGGRGWRQHSGKLRHLALSLLLFKQYNMLNRLRFLCSKLGDEGQVDLNIRVCDTAVPSSISNPTNSEVANGNTWEVQ